MYAGHSLAHMGHTAVCPSFCIALLAVSCASNVETEATSDTVELFSWWTSKSERGALNALLEVHEEEHPDVQVINASESLAAKARDRLVERLSTGLPPDTFQANIGRDLFRWVLFNGEDDRDTKVESLGDLVVENDWDRHLPRPVRDALSFGDELYGVPVNVHRLNSLFYDSATFERLDLAPPETLEELFVTLDALVAAGYEHPLSIGNRNDWTMALFTMENLFPAVAGPELYLDYWSGREEPEHPKMRETLDVLLRLWPYFNEDANTIDWVEGVERLFASDADRRAAMTVMGDWAKGQLQADGYEPGEDFGQVPFPGTVGTFVFTSDSFPLPKGAPNRKRAIELLTTFGSKRGQLAFNALKGSIPAREDIDPETDLDVLARRTWRDFHRDRVVVALSGLIDPTVAAALAEALRDTLLDRDPDPVLFALRNYYAEFGPR